MTDFTFNCNEAPAPENFEPIPVGTEVVAEIANTDLGQANAKGTQRLKLTYKVLDGTHKGRQINQWLSVICPTSDKAVEIAQRTLREICEAIGLKGFKMTEELHGKPLVVKVGQEEPNDAGDIYNSVKRVKKCGVSLTQEDAATNPSEAPDWAN
jgi:hypothetical protein